MVAVVDGNREGKGRGKLQSDLQQARAVKTNLSTDHSDGGPALKPKSFGGGCKPRISKTLNENQSKSR